MTPEQARDAICHSLHEVAPDADPDHLRSDVTLQEALDLDSLDFLHFVASLQQRAGVEIIERDYPRLFTIDDCVSFLVLRTAPVDA